MKRVLTHRLSECGVICLDWHFDFCPAVALVFPVAPSLFCCYCLERIAFFGECGCGVLHCMLIEKNSDHAENHEEGKNYLTVLSRKPHC